MKLLCVKHDVVEPHDQDVCEIDMKGSSVKQITPALIVESDADDPNSTVADLPDGASLVDPATGFHYQLTTEGGTRVAYRIFQVSEASSNSDSNIEGISQIIGGSGSGLSQAILTSSLTITGVDSHDGSSGTTVAVSPTGSLYVIGNSQDVLGSGHRTLVPRLESKNYDNCRNNNVRDERRRATHNEVERRRRDKINNWITKLSKVIPDCLNDQTKQGQSKGGILAKACDYICDLRERNQKLLERLKEVDALRQELELLRRQNEDLCSENSMLKSHLQKRSSGS